MRCSERLKAEYLIGEKRVRQKGLLIQNRCQLGNYKGLIINKHRKIKLGFIQKFLKSTW